MIHFAGLKAVGESVAQPLLYYRVNMTAAMNLVEVSCLLSCDFSSFCCLGLHDQQELTVYNASSALMSKV